jgi:FkbM family methyltransferase
MLMQTADDPPLLERALVQYARRFPVNRGKLRVIDSLWQAAAGRRGTHRVATLRHAGFRMSCDLREMLQRQFYFFGTYFMERDVLESWERAAQNARVVLDVGANAGIFSLAALAVSPDATVHSFEPTPEIALRLRGTAAMNRLAGLHVHELAVLGTEGTAHLHRFRGESDDNEGMNFVTPGSSAGESVSAITIDGFCAAHDIERIDLLKIDIQGNEFEALSGAERMIATGRIATIFSELNWAAEGDPTCPANASIRLLEGAGYQFAGPQSFGQWRSSGAWMRSLSNVIATREMDQLQ